MPTTILCNSVGDVGMPTAIAALVAGRSALDAIEAGIRLVEADPSVHSVGVGGWPNLLGEMELDAGIMDGRTRAMGAVGALRDHPHAISVARQVMFRLPHVLLVGDGAARFADECGEAAGPVLTEDVQRRWAAWVEAHLSTEERMRWPRTPLADLSWLTTDPDITKGTTVYLAIDASGDIGVGVSTCGWAYKYPGRLGDSPVAGAGFYADNRFGAAACTGYGELTMRAGTARAVVLHLQLGMSPADACHAAIDDLRAVARAFPGGVTVHALAPDGACHVQSVGLDEQWGYCVWRAGMTAHETHLADLVDW
jgi:L-asparaginase / beta-aspartyl-peptidase